MSYYNDYKYFFKTIESSESERFSIFKFLYIDLRTNNLLDSLFEPEILNDLEKNELSCLSNKLLMN